MQYFCSSNVDGAAECWVEAKMSWVEVSGTECSRVEVDGAGRRWVHGLEIPICKYFIKKYALTIDLFVFLKTIYLKCRNYLQFNISKALTFFA